MSSKLMVISDRATCPDSSRYSRAMDRFDDVETRIVEEPTPAPPPRAPRRLGHAAVALTAAAVLTGTLAASATALTSTAQAPTRATEQRSDEGGSWWDGKCRKGEGHRRSTVTY